MDGISVSEFDLKFNIFNLLKFSTPWKPKQRGIQVPQAPPGVEFMTVYKEVDLYNTLSEEVALDIVPLAAVRFLFTPCGILIVGIKVWRFEDFFFQFQKPNSLFFNAPKSFEKLNK
ncbi:hypothetical protein ACJIZ3_003225 [Penstemon smallii]|uniref:Uncharacterized protein n=1 Tax=Penstemon smallii TaxID=265156 RepID=A0ABD3U8M0_9LAMI